MAGTSHVQTSGSNSGKERRAYPRYPISLAAQIVSIRKGACAGIITDYCIGGMYVQLVSSELLPQGASSYLPQMDDRIEILADITVAGVEKQIVFEAEVKRANSQFVGISFINPDISSVQALHKYASGVRKNKKEASVASTSSASQQVFNGKSAAVILNEAHHLMESGLAPLMEKFHASISDHFFVAAKETFDMAKQNALFESLGVLEKSKNKITQKFISSYKDKLKHYSPADVLHEDEEIEKEFSLESMSLVGEDEFDHWLSISSIVNNIDADNREALSQVERRSSALYGEKINKRNNPFGPAMFAQAFQDAIEQIDIKHAVKLVCYTSFRDIYLAEAKDIYEKLNEYFIKNDVLPKLTYEVAKSAMPKNSASAGIEDEPEAEEPPADEGDFQQPSVPASPPRGGQASGPIPTSAITPASRGIAPNIQGRTAAEGRQQVASMHQAHSQGGQASGSQNLLEVFSDIRGLQNDLQHTQSGELIPAGTGGPVKPSFSTSELLNALSSSQLSGYSFAQQSEEEDQQEAFKAQIQEILSKQSADGEEKIISEQATRVIDVASNVFGTLMSDMQVAESIRPWVQQLEMPVLKMAILDDSVFTDKSHIVRSVINKIAELEVLADTDDMEEQAAVQRAFDWLVKVINEDFDGTSKVFERISQQLDILIKIQAQTFDKNLKTVVDEFLDEDQIPEEEAVEAKTAAATDEDEWVRRVSRLEEGDWVLFDAFSDVPIRLKVGWVAKHGGKFVFVNVLGKKEKVLKSDELVELFKQGETIVLDDQDEPAMDRAQYTMLQKLHKQLIFQSSHDQVTGLINRREFEICMQQAIDDAKISNAKHALCYIDLDKFNVINNSCGYDGGDALLKEITEILKNKLSENSVLARLGGDEFCMLLCGHSTDDALDIIEDLLAELNEYRFVWGDKKLSVAMSVGLTVIKGHGQEVAKLIQAAESSCEVAKEMGGHRVQVFHEAHARLSKRSAEMEWAAKIDRALDTDSLHLRCQRIMPLSTEDTYHDHYEILLGMTDELGEQNSLQEFIRAAETYKRMSELDRWVIKKSFTWIANNRAKLDHISSFSINLSGHSLNDLGLMEFVMKQMRDTNVPIGKICFEITETLGIANLTDAADFIKRFKTTGCRFSLDDFGSGMSSYGYLKSLPVDYLKIDGVFVKEMATNPNDYAVVKSISEIGHFMGKKVIAEFVQDDETIQLLQDLGVDYAQGYGIERPHKLDDILR